MPSIRLQVLNEMLQVCKNASLSSFGTEFIVIQQIKELILFYSVNKAYLTEQVLQDLKQKLVDCGIPLVPSSSITSVQEEKQDTYFSILDAKHKKTFCSISQIQS